MNRRQRRERARRRPRRACQGKRWKRVRNAALARAGYRCERCGAAPERLEAHHIKPLGKGGPPLELNNLEILCPVCHQAEHADDGPQDGDSD